MGRRGVEIGLVPKPTITDPSDAIIQVTHCTISGSDPHLYEGDLGYIM
jgi:threonine dehydrogenase-like Zn-dependent dehydrogenase